MNQRPQSADFVRQESSILIVRRHDDTESFEAQKVAGKRQRHSGTALRIGRVSHSVLLQLRNVRDTRILDAPEFLGVLLRIRYEGWRGIDAPAIHSILRAS